jgi:hypothetical protein
MSAVNICREHDCACQEVAEWHRCQTCPERVKPLMDPARVRELTTALARRDALLRQAMEAMQAIRQSAMTNKVLHAIAAISAELKDTL